MTLAAVSTALSISITLLIIVLVVVSLMMILVVMMQRPKQEGLGAAFGGGMTDQLLGAGTTSFLQKATVVLGILFFVLSLVLGILVGRSNKIQELDVKAPQPSEQNAAPVPGIATGIDIPADDDEAKILEAIESAMEPESSEGAEGSPAETPSEETPSEETAPAEDAVEPLQQPLLEAAEEVIESAEGVIESAEEVNPEAAEGE